MNIRLIFHLLGKATMVEGALIVPSIIVALIYREGDAAALAIGAAIAVALGLLLSQLVKPHNKNFRAREGFVAVALIWIVFSAIGALPFMIHGVIPTFTDSFFEMAAGFTTTGSTILPNIEVLPKGLMFWRSFTHWVGGMGVLVLSLALLPNMASRSTHLLKAEASGVTPGKLVPRIGNSARLLYRIYIALTILLLTALLLCGMNGYDALIHTFGAAGTGGCSNYAHGVAHFDSPAIEMVLAVFMLLFGVNFSIFYVILLKYFRVAYHNSELRAYIGIVATAIVLIAINLRPVVGGALEALRQSVFQVTSVITTSGYASVNFNAWPQFSRWVLVALMLIGGCGGSTAGGMKVIRWTVLFKAMRREVGRAIHPRNVAVVKIDGRAVEEATVQQVSMFFFMYMMLIGLATLIVSIDGFGLETNLTAAIACVSNVGTGLGAIGPFGHFAGFSTLSKWVLSFCMLIGRLEIYPMLVLVMPSTWAKK